MGPVLEAQHSDTTDVPNDSSITTANLDLPTHRVRTRSQTRFENSVPPTDMSSISIPDARPSNTTNQSTRSTQGQLVECNGMQYIMIPGVSTLFPLPSAQSHEDELASISSTPVSSVLFTFPNGQKNHARHVLSNQSRSTLAKSSITAKLGFEGTGFTPIGYRNLQTFFVGLFLMADCGCSQTFEYIEDDANEHLVSESFSTVLWF